jgi:hypothetical protein
MGANKVMCQRSCCVTKSNNWQNTRMTDTSVRPESGHARLKHLSEIANTTTCASNGGQDREGHCGHGCHCSLMAISPLFLFAKSGIYIPLTSHLQQRSVFIPLRLPPGFDFIWRPPKIGNKLIG